MKTMKSLIVSALLLGMFGVAHAGGRAGGGWKAYTLTASSGQVFVGNGFINSAFLSTGPAGDFAVIADTVNVSTGSFIGNVTFNPYATLTPTQQVASGIAFLSTSTVVGGSGTNGANAYWSAGQAPDDYIEIQNGLWIWKNSAATTGSQITVYYSK